MLRYDEKVYKQTAGQIGEAIEQAITNFSHQDDNSQKHPLFGAVIPLKSILVNRENAKNIVFQIAKEFWGNIDLFLFDKLQDTSIDLEHANDRLKHFFNSTQGKNSTFPIFRDSQQTSLRPFN